MPLRLCRTPVWDNEAGRGRRRAVSGLELKADKGRGRKKRGGQVVKVSSCFFSASLFNLSENLEGQTNLFVSWFNLFENLDEGG